MIDICFCVQNTGIVSGQRLAHLHTSLVLVAQDLDTLAHCDVVVAAVVVVGLETVAGGRGTRLHQRGLSLLLLYNKAAGVLGCMWNNTN